MIPYQVSGEAINKFRLWFQIWYVDVIPGVVLVPNIDVGVYDPADCVFDRQQIYY